MRTSRTIRKSVPFAVARVLAPLAFLATAAVVAAQGPNDSSAIPSAPAPSAPVSEAPQAPALPPTSPPRLRIAVLRAGPAPYPWLVPGRIARSFITDSARSLDVVAQARVKGDPALVDEVQWEIEPPPGFVVPPDASLSGQTLSVHLVREAGNPTGGGGPLSITVTARVSGETETLQDGMTLTQDLRDRLRQEYVDLARAYVPARTEFLDETEFTRLYRRRYPRVSFQQLNWSRQPGSEERYPAILASETLVQTLNEIETVYGRPLVVSSGFRNPVRQVEVHAAVEESHHQYGRAADLYVPPDSAPPRTGRTIALPADWLRLAAAAIRGGGAWIEPMLDCHVNTAGCHVHVDVRDSGARSRIVQVAGTVTGPTGAPIPGATVELAGMPVQSNAQGRYTLKHVLTPREYELKVTAPGGEERTQAVLIGETGAVASVVMPADASIRTASIFPGPAAPPSQVPASEQQRISAPPVPATRTEGLREVTPVPTKAITVPQSGPDLSAAAGGAAVGAAAGIAGGAAKKRLLKKPEPAEEPAAEPEAPGEKKD